PGGLPSEHDRVVTHPPMMERPPRVTQFASDFVARFHQFFNPLLVIMRNKFNRAILTRKLIMRHEHFVPPIGNRNSLRLHQFPDFLMTLESFGAIKAVNAVLRKERLVVVLVKEENLGGPSHRSEEHTSELQSRENLV